SSLHSFPTRRSSDLPPAPEAGAGAAGAGHQHGLGLRLQAGRRANRVAGPPAAQPYPSGTETRKPLSAGSAKPSVSGSSAFRKKRSEEHTSELQSLRH